MTLLVRVYILIAEIFGIAAIVCGFLCCAESSFTCAIIGFLSMMLVFILLMLDGGRNDEDLDK